MAVRQELSYLDHGFRVHRQEALERGARPVSAQKAEK
jgi:hypothetical protein